MARPAVKPGVDAARDGEQILVKAGTYGPALSQLKISDKGLAICAEALRLYLSEKGELPPKPLLAGVAARQPDGKKLAEDP